MLPDVLLRECTPEEETPGSSERNQHGGEIEEEKHENPEKLDVREDEKKRKSYKKETPEKQAKPQEKIKFQKPPTNVQPTKKSTRSRPAMIRENTRDSAARTVTSTVPPNGTSARDPAITIQHITLTALLFILTWLSKMVTPGPNASSNGKKNADDGWRTERVIAARRAEKGPAQRHRMRRRKRRKRSVHHIAEKLKTATSVLIIAIVTRAQGIWQAKAGIERKPPSPTKNNKQGTTQGISTSAPNPSRRGRETISEHGTSRNEGLCTGLKRVVRYYRRKRSKNGWRGRRSKKKKRRKKKGKKKGSDARYCGATGPGIRKTTTSTRCGLRKTALTQLILQLGETRKKRGSVCQHHRMMTSYMKKAVREKRKKNKKHGWRARKCAAASKLKCGKKFKSRRNLKRFERYVRCEEARATRRGRRRRNRLKGVTSVVKRRSRCATITSSRYHSTPDGSTTNTERHRIALHIRRRNKRIAYAKQTKRRRMLTKRKNKWKISQTIKPKKRRNCYSIEVSLKRSYKEENAEAKKRDKDKDFISDHPIDEVMVELSHKGGVDHEEAKLKWNLSEREIDASAGDETSAPKSTDGKPGSLTIDSATSLEAQCASKTLRRMHHRDNTPPHTALLGIILSHTPAYRMFRVGVGILPTSRWFHASIRRTYHTIPYPIPDV